MSNKHKSVWIAIFKNPIQANVKWDDIEKLFKHLGCFIKEGEGSRVAVEYNGVRGYFHRPHPQKEIDKGALKSVRKFIENSGVKIC